MLVFDKEKTLKLIKECGNGDKITDEIVKEMDNYDGCEAVKSGWDALVHDIELYIIKGKNGNTIKVEKNQLKEIR